MSDLFEDITEGFVTVVTDDVDNEYDEAFGPTDPHSRPVFEDSLRNGR